MMTTTAFYVPPAKPYRVKVSLDRRSAMVTFFYRHPKPDEPISVSYTVRRLPCGGLQCNCPDWRFRVRTPHPVGRNCKHCRHLTPCLPPY